MTNSTSKTYILNDERFGSEAYLVHADNDEQLTAEMPCIVDWANEIYNDPDYSGTREEALAGKISDTWAALEPAIEIPNHPELVACYEHGKYSVYTRLAGDMLKWSENVAELTDVSVE